MKKITSFLKPLAVAIVLLAGVNSANALGLKGFSPDPFRLNGVVAGGMPAWFQDQNGVAVKPCLDVARCGLASGPGFNAGLPVSWPNNFPDEFFYFAADADVALGTSSALVVMALEAMTLDAFGNPALPATPGTLTVPFQRLRLVHTSPGQGGVLTPAQLAGNFTITTPWGVTTFAATDPAVKCVNTGGDTKCSMTRDLFSVPPAFTPALGAGIAAPDSAISTFLRDPSLDPALGFLGLGAGAPSFTGGTLGNIVTVSDPFGNTGSTTALSLLMGQTVGMEITPPATGKDFGVVKAAPGSVRKTFIVNNLTGAVVGAVPVTVPPTPPNPLKFTPNVTNSNPLAVSTDFTIAATPPAAIVAPATKACDLGATATMAIAEACSFDVIFSPTTADGPKSATIIISGANSPTAQLTVTGIADGTVPALAITGISKFTKSPTQTISGTVTDLNGVAGVTVSIDGAAPAAVTTLDNVAGTWTFATPALAAQLPDALPGVGAHSISVIATDNAQSTAIASLGGNLGTAVDSITVDNTLPAVAITTPAAGIFTNNNTPLATFTATDTNLAVTTLKVDGNIVTTSPTSPATLAVLGDGFHNVTIDANDAAGNFTTVTNSFTVDTTAPVISITNPAVAAKPAVTVPAITTTSTIGVTSPVLTFPIADANLDPLQTKVTLDGVAIANPVSGTTTLGPFVVGEPHTLTIDATDKAGNVATQKLVNFSLLLTDGSIASLGAAPPTIADVILALKVAIGGFPEAAAITPATDAFKHGDVSPLVNGVPAPDGLIDVGDVLTILKKVVGLTTTF